MSDEYEKCDRCGRDAIPDDIQEIHLEEDHDVCYGCVEALVTEIENYEWQDRYTEEQHERAVSLLSERSEIECIIEDYSRGEIIVHTEYVSSDVITDFCNHFGYNIVSFNPQWQEVGDWKCLDSHGSIFEIRLRYDHHCLEPANLDMKFIENHIGDLTENDKQF